MPADLNTAGAPAYRAPAVHKAFQLLHAVARSPQRLGIVDLAQRLGYSKSTAHGIVHALLREGALAQDPSTRKLFLGPAIADLLFCDWHPETAARTAQPILNALRERIHKTVFLGVRMRHRVLIIAAAEAPEGLRISAPVGITIPLLAGAVGKVFMAAEDPRRARQLIAEIGLPRFTSRSMTDMATYLSELEQVRSRGYAVDIEEYIDGVRAVAAALQNRRGLAAAVWVVDFSSGMPRGQIRQIAAATTVTAEELRAELDRQPTIAASDH